MKNKFLAMALSCAVMALVVAPSASADNVGASGEVTGANGITATGTDYTIPSASATTLLSASDTKCYSDDTTVDADTDGMTSGNPNFFVVTDVDAVGGHTVTFQPAAANFTDNTNSAIPSTALAISAETTDDDCTDQESNTQIQAMTFVAGLAGDVTNVEFDKLDLAGGTSYVPLDSVGPALFITSTEADSLQYKFRLGSIKLVYPQGTQVGNYSMTITATYNPS